MAAIRRRGDRINVQIRKKGYPFISKSFVSLTVAKKWAATTEADMERRLHIVIPDDRTVGELLNRYDRGSNIPVKNTLLLVRPRIWIDNDQKYSF